MSLRGKSEWREYFKGKRQRTMTSKERNRVLQHSKEVAKQAMTDLVLISKGLHYLTDSFNKAKKAKEHRLKTFPRALTGQCFFQFFIEAKRQHVQIQKLFSEKREETISNAQGFSISQLNIAKEQEQT